jgi:hypothetical protein
MIHIEPGRALVVAVFVVALAVFAWASFRLSRFSSEVRRSLENRHAEVLKQIAPGSSASWLAHWIWQSDYNVVHCALPLLKNVQDADLARQIKRFRRVRAIGVASLAAAAFALIAIVAR